MNQQIYRQHNKKRSLSKLFESSAELRGELIDASICNQIAIDLFKLRESSGLTQQELADSIGVQQSNISRWETPGYQGYKVKILSKIVRALGGKFSVSIKPKTVMSFEFRYSNGAYLNSVTSSEWSSSHGALNPIPKSRVKEYTNA